MRKFKVNVEITKEYEIEIDETKITNEELEAWESVFYDLDIEEDKLASYVANYCELRANLGTGFIEGYGVVTEKGKKPYGVKDIEINEEMKIIKAYDSGFTDVTIEEIN